MNKSIVIVLAIVVLVGGGVAAFMLTKGGTDDDSNGRNGSRPQLTKPHVILISVDTLRADRLSCMGYTAHQTPVMDALAAEGVLFERCFTPNPLTLPAHTSMLTGTSPIFHRVRDNTFTVVPADGMRTMAEEFASNGYFTAGFVSSIVMEKASGIGRGFSHWDDRLPKDASGEGLLMPERNAKQTLAAAREWMLKQPTDKPMFVFIHLFDPHFPFDPPEAEFKVGLKAPVDHSPEELKPLYDAEVRYTDAKLGEFFGSLRSDGIWDQAVVALTADHGEGLGDRGEMTHGYFVYDGTTHIPLIIKPTKAAKLSAKVSTPVTTTDLMPTLSRMAGLTLSELAGRQQQGEDLMPFVKGERDGKGRSVYIESHYGHNNAGWARLRALRSSDRLVVVHPSAPEMYLDAAQVVNELADMATANDTDKTAYNDVRDSISKLLATWYNPNIKQVLRGSSSGAYYAEGTPEKPGYNEGKPTGYNEGKPTGYNEGKPAAYGAEATPYPGESINKTAVKQESLADDEGLPSAHTKATALGLYQRAELLYSRGQNGSALARLRELLVTEPNMLPALRLAARASGNLANTSRRDRDQSRTHIADAAQFATRAADSAKSLGLHLAAVDVRASALLWRIMLGEESAVRDESLATLDKDHATMSPEVFDRYQRLVHMAAYRLAGSDQAKRIDTGKRLSQTLKDRKAHQSLVDLMMAGRDLPLAPWEVR